MPQKNQNNTLLLLLAFLFLLVALFGIGGCATLGALLTPAPTTQPTTPEQQINNLQKDLDTIRAGFRLAHEFGGFQRKDEWERIQHYEALAQVGIDAARDALVHPPGEDEPTLADLLNEAADLVHTYKNSDTSE
jgi:hypothetical protein